MSADLHLDDYAINAARPVRTRFHVVAIASLAALHRPTASPGLARSRGDGGVDSASFDSSATTRFDNVKKTIDALRETVTTNSLKRTDLDHNVQQGDPAGLTVGARGSEKLEE